MHPIAQRAEILLQSDVHPSLTLSELTAVLRRDVDHALTASRLRPLLEKHPARFRLLDTWVGGWHSAGGAESERTWVVAVGSSVPPPGLRPAAFRLRESVRWLGCGLDGRSRTETARWYAIAHTERATREAFVRRAA